MKTFKDILLESGAQYAKNVNVRGKDNSLAHDVNLSGRYDKVAGNFELKGQIGRTYTLFNLDSSDTKYVKKALVGSVKGSIYRAQTRNMEAGGMSVLVAVDLAKGLIYFPDVDPNDDTELRFEGRGEKPVFINIIED